MRLTWGVVPQQKSLELHADVLTPMIFVDSLGCWVYTIYVNPSLNWFLDVMSFSKIPTTVNATRTHLCAWVDRMCEDLPKVL